MLPVVAVLGNEGSHSLEIDFVLRVALNVKEHSEGGLADGTLDFECLIKHPI